jgi:PAS domain S-box-containing protein
VSCADGAPATRPARRRSNMDEPRENSAEEIKRLQRCINDLVSVLALPAMWTGAEPTQIAGTLLDTLLAMLRLDLVYVRLKDPVGETQSEMVRVAQSQKLTARPQEIGEAINHSLGDDPQGWPARARDVMGGTELSIVPWPLGLQGEIGVIVACSERADFPRETEKLLLSVAANQASLALTEARLLSEHKRISSELERRVAQRTAELAAANQELQLRVSMLQQIPVAAWSVEPDGSPDIVNHGWLEYTGQTLDYVRSAPEAWMATLHPEDRERASQIYWGGIRSGQGFTMEARFRRAQDGTYRWHLNRAVALRDAAGKITRFVGTSTDIEEQKQSQENYRRAEEKTRSIIDTALDAVVAIDASGAITTWNKQAETVFGWSREEAMGQRLSNLIIPERQRMAHERGLAHFLATGAGPILRRRIELTAVRRNGVEFPVDLEVMPMRVGEDWIFSAFLRDITERKEAEEALRASQRSLTSIINTIPTLAWSTFPDGYCDFTNQSWREFTGLSAEQGRGWGWGASIHPEDLSGLMEYWRSCLASGTPVDTEARMRRFDGEYRWFLFRANPWHDEFGNIVKWYGTNTDIDDRKRAERELQRKEAFLAEAQRLSLTGSFTWRVDTEEISFSEQLYRIFEFEQNSPVTIAQIGSLVHPDDIPVLTEKVILARSGVNDHNYEIRLQMPDGRMKYLRTDAYGSQDRDGRLEYLGVIQDVTERRLSEEALARLQSELAHMTRVMTMGQLTASIAHEVNQPLSGIITNASTCLRMLAADPPNVIGALETTRRTIRDGNRASEVITRLRALYSKKEGSPESMDLNEATEEVIILSLSELQKNRIVLRPELTEQLPPVTGDRVQLQQVIMNLLRNASDAMSAVNDRPRELTIRTEREEGDRVRLTVQDAGVGFDPQAMERLFEAFYTTKNDGMGMGLSVSRSIIESHQGRLWAALNDGPGAAFSFSIPCASKGATDARSLGAH